MKGIFMYKTEPHLHVSELGPCSKLSAREAVGGFEIQEGKRIV